MDLLTTGQLAISLGLQHWQIVAAMRRNLLKPAGKVGNRYVFNVADLPEIRRVMTENGYIPSTLVAC